MTAPTDVTFSAGTKITSQWLNGVNDHVNNLEADPHPSYLSKTEAATVYTTQADLASSADGKGGELVEYQGSTVEAALNERLPEIGTYALLRAYTGPVTAFMVRGVANVFDGGFGVFRVDAADTTTADNGGTVLVDASGRRWKRDYSGDVIVKWFGAAGNGTDNDYQAIVNAKTQCGLTGEVLRFTKGTYFIGANELVFSEAGIVIKCDAGAEIQGNGGTDGGYVVSFAKSGGTAQITGSHPTNQRVTGLRVRAVSPFSSDGERAAIRVCGSYNLFLDCSVTTSYDNGSNGWRLEADNSGSGPYYNTFTDCTAQGPQNGLSTGTGIMMRQKAGTSVATRYPNTNTFIGGRVGGYAVNVEIAGAGNRFLGIANENSVGFGTAFKWVAPVASSNAQNELFSPYIENAAIGFEVQANTSSPQVFGYYASGVTTLISDTSNRLTVFGGDGIRGVRLAKSPNASAARSGIYVGNTGNSDAETLDWYEEVTFTPIMVGSTTLSTGTTHSVQVGRATRIGNRVFFSGTCVWTASTETGNIQIDLNDIPWASNSASNTNSPVNVRANTLVWSAGKQLVGLTLTGTKRFQLEQLDPAGGAVAQIPMDTAASVFFSGAYIV